MPYGYPGNAIRRRSAVQSQPAASLEPFASSMSIRWPGRPLGSHAWILIAMFQLAVDLPTCEALGPGSEFWLLPRSPPRPPRLWSFRSGQPARVPTPVWSPRPPRVERTHGQMQVSRARRAHKPRDQVAALVPKAGLAKPPAVAKSSPSIASSSSSSSSSSAVAGGAPEQQALLRRGKRHLQGDGLTSFDSRGSRPTTETEFIAWGPTGDEEGLESNTLPAIYGPTTVSILQTRKTTVAATTATTTATPMTLQTKGFTESLDPRRRIPGGLSTTEPATSPSNSGEATQPPRILGEASGLAVHQIITITVSLIMVIAALITTLVLKNCCAQSGNTRRNSHQRKTNQQEESCQNLTDFTSARVPSSLDIFTAYNETLQCSHECVRASVPVYTDETLHSTTGEYKSTFNGNRPSSSDRHLIPVAFVSEKWFEISC
uniref:Adherens junctions associated protein 1 n=1 Tax=Callithrix jacchus TaxID=9483 RepID=A0A8I4A2H2_CALJA|nr:adherens junction-associated protein 1 isoform X1 [Callithrix jacchus]XP_054114709.1 adherens junction-associated protein 1 isoform X1 [Callithrix jacchus]